MSRRKTSSHASFCSSVSASAGVGSANGLSLTVIALAVEFVGETDSAWCTGGEVACGMLCVKKQSASGSGSFHSIRSTSPQAGGRCTKEERRMQKGPGQKG